MKKNIVLIVLILSIVGITINAKGFGVGKNNKGQRPNVYDSIISNNNGYSIGEDDKRIYLTFDAGYENGNIEKILDILKIL